MKNMSRHAMRALKNAKNVETSARKWQALVLQMNVQMIVANAASPVMNVLLLAKTVLSNVKNTSRHLKIKAL
jgi:hypothetical protein